jgi:LPXTG-site transpeptidase (sortase) family protein
VPVAERGAAAPVRIGIPRLGVTSTLVGLRKDRAGRLQVPTDYARAGWYSQGPAPGDRGPAVIAGHVDSFRGPAVFARLGSLRKGDRIAVRRADGTLRTYAVTLVRTYAKRDFPTELVYRGDGRESLRLITCGGDFDRRSKSYRSNVVVFAAPV